MAKHDFQEGERALVVTGPGYISVAEGLTVSRAAFSPFRPGLFLKGNLRKGTKLSQPRGRQGYAVL